jgi:hypothetical protein
MLIEQLEESFFLFNDPLINEDTIIKIISKALIIQTKKYILDVIKFILNLSY